MTETVLTQLDEHGVLLVTLNRPEKKNAFNNAQWLALKSALESAQDDASVACVVITGAGQDFSAGVDLNSFADVKDSQNF